MVIDTSALLAIVFREATRPGLLDAIDQANSRMIFRRRT
jgi:uncharacterized protein with PIN domain